MNVIIMPVVNGMAMTRRCVMSAMAQDCGDIEIIAIDNGSTDGCGALLRSLPVRYWPRRRQSLHKIWNDAIGYCFETGEDHVLVINNDVWLRPDTYRVLLADGGAFVTGVAVSNMKELALSDPTSKSPHPSFSCFLIRENVWRKIGPFDLRFWVYAGDCDYHMRMDKAGIDAYSIALPFYHEVSGTIKNSSEEEKKEIARQADTDRFVFEGKWGLKIGTPEYDAAFRRLDGTASPNV